MKTFQEQLNELNHFYSVAPDRFSDNQKERLLQMNQMYENNKSYFDTEHEDTGLIRDALNTIGQVGLGFAEGFTTLDMPYMQPQTEAQNIARKIGSLGGFVGYIPNPVNLGKTALVKLGFGTVAKKLAAKKLGTSAVKKMSVKEVNDAALGLLKKQGSNMMPIKSLPIYVSDKITDYFVKTAGGKKIGKIIEMGFKNPEARFFHQANIKEIARGAFHLGTASAVATTGLNFGEYGERIKQVPEAFLSGALFGGAFKIIGNLGLISERLLQKGMPTLSAKVIQGIAGSVFQGLPYTIQGASTSEQVYEYLLGAWFGYHERPWTTVEKAKIMNDINKKWTSDLEVKEIPITVGFNTPEGQEAFKARKGKTPQEEFLEPLKKVYPKEVYGAIENEYKKMLDSYSVERLRELTDENNQVIPIDMIHVADEKGKIISVPVFRLNPVMNRERIESGAKYIEPNENYPTGAIVVDKAALEMQIPIWLKEGMKSTDPTVPDIKPGVFSTREEIIDFIYAHEAFHKLGYNEQVSTAMALSNALGTKASNVIKENFPEFYGLKEVQDMLEIHKSLDAKAENIRFSTDENQNILGYKVLLSNGKRGYIFGRIDKTNFEFIPADKVEFSEDGIIQKVGSTEKIKEEQIYKILSKDIKGKKSTKQDYANSIDGILLRELGEEYFIPKEFTWSFNENQLNTKIKEIRIALKHDNLERVNVDPILAERMLENFDELKIPDKMKEPIFDFLEKSIKEPRVDIPDNVPKELIEQYKERFTEPDIEEPKIDIPEPKFPEPKIIEPKITEPRIEEPKIEEPKINELSQSAKKAEIERRRQEELNEYKDKDVSKVEEFTFTDDDGNVTYVQIRTYPDGKRMAYQGIEKNKYGNVNDSSPFEISKEQSTEDYLKVAYPESTFGTSAKTGERTGEEASLNAYSRKINAKYDAELAALNETKPVEKVDKIEAKKVDIERQNQEELNKIENSINDKRFAQDEMHKKHWQNELFKTKLKYLKETLRKPIKTAQAIYDLTILLNDVRSALNTGISDTKEGNELQKELEKSFVKIANNLLKTVPSNIINDYILFRNTKMKHKDQTVEKDLLIADDGSVSIDGLNQEYFLTKEIVDTKTNSEYDKYNAELKALEQPTSTPQSENVVIDELNGRKPAVKSNLPTKNELYEQKVESNSRGKHLLKKVITGGQTGSDLGGLEGAKESGLETGGTAPPRWWSGKKSEKALLESYGLKEGEPDPATYPKRTMKNVDDSDGTVAVLWGNSVGTGKTIGYAQTKKWKYGTGKTQENGYKPVYVAKTNDLQTEAKNLADFIIRNNIETLNVAGHRESSQKGIQEFTKRLIIETNKILQDNATERSQKPVETRTTKKGTQIPISENKPVEQLKTEKPESIKPIITEQNRTSELETSENKSEENNSKDEYGVTQQESLENLFALTARKKTSLDVKLEEALDLFMEKQKQSQEDYGLKEFKNILRTSLKTKDISFNELKKKYFDIYNEYIENPNEWLGKNKDNENITVLEHTFDKPDFVYTLNSMQEVNKIVFNNEVITQKKDLFTNNRLTRILEEKGILDDTIIIEKRVSKRIENIVKTLDSYEDYKYYTISDMLSMLKEGNKKSQQKAKEIEDLLPDLNEYLDLGRISDKMNIIIKIPKGKTKDSFLQDIYEMTLGKKYVDTASPNKIVKYLGQFLTPAYTLGTNGKYKVIVINDEFADGKKYAWQLSQNDIDKDSLYYEILGSSPDKSMVDGMIIGNKAFWEQKMSYYYNVDSGSSKPSITYAKDGKHFVGKGELSYREDFDKFLERQGLDINEPYLLFFNTSAKVKDIGIKSANITKNQYLDPEFKTKFDIGELPDESFGFLKDEHLINNSTLTTQILDTYTKNYNAKDFVETYVLPQISRIDELREKVSDPETLIKMILEERKIDLDNLKFRNDFSDELVVGYAKNLLNGAHPLSPYLYNTTKMILKRFYENAVSPKHPDITYVKIRGEIVPDGKRLQERKIVEKDGQKLVTPSEAKLASDFAEKEYDIHKIWVFDNVNNDYLPLMATDAKIAQTITVQNNKKIRLALKDIMKYLENTNYQVVFALQRSPKQKPIDSIVFTPKEFIKKKEGNFVELATLDASIATESDWDGDAININPYLNKGYVEEATKNIFINNKLRTAQTTIRSQDYQKLKRDLTGNDEAFDIRKYDDYMLIIKNAYVGINSVGSAVNNKSVLNGAFNSNVSFNITLNGKKVNISLPQFKNISDQARIEQIENDLSYYIQTAVDSLKSEIPEFWHKPYRHIAYMKLLKGENPNLSKLTFDDFVTYWALSPLRNATVGLKPQNFEDSSSAMLSNFSEALIFHKALQNGLESFNDTIGIKAFLEYKRLTENDKNSDISKMVQMGWRGLTKKKVTLESLNEWQKQMLLNPAYRKRSKDKSGWDLKQGIKTVIEIPIFNFTSESYSEIMQAPKIQIMNAMAGERYDYDAVDKIFPPSFIKPTASLFDSANKHKQSVLSEYEQVNSQISNLINNNALIRMYEVMFPDIRYKNGYQSGKINEKVFYNLYDFIKNAKRKDGSPLMNNQQIDLFNKILIANYGIRSIKKVPKYEYNAGIKKTKTNQSISNFERYVKSLDFDYSQEMNVKFIERLKEMIRGNEFAGIENIENYINTSFDKLLSEVPESVYALLFSKPRNDFYLKKVRKENPNLSDKELNKLFVRQIAQGKDTMDFYDPPIRLYDRLPDKYKKALNKYFLESAEDYYGKSSNFVGRKQRDRFTIREHKLPYKVDEKYYAPIVKAGSSAGKPLKQYQIDFLNELFRDQPHIKNKFHGILEWLFGRPYMISDEEFYHFMEIMNKHKDGKPFLGIVQKFKGMDAIGRDIKSWATEWERPYKADIHNTQIAPISLPNKLREVFSRAKVEIDKEKRLYIRLMEAIFTNFGKNLDESIINSYGREDGGHPILTKKEEIWLEEMKKIVNNEYGNRDIIFDVATKKYEYDEYVKFAKSNDFDPLIMKIRKERWESVKDIYETFSEGEKIYTGYVNRHLLKFAKYVRNNHIVASKSNKYSVDRITQKVKILQLRSLINRMKDSLELQNKEKADDSYKALFKKLKDIEKYYESLLKAEAKGIILNPTGYQEGYFHHTWKSREHFEEAIKEALKTEKDPDRIQKLNDLLDNYHDYYQQDAVSELLRDPIHSLGETYSLNKSNPAVLQRDLNLGGYDTYAPRVLNKYIDYVIHQSIKMEHGYEARIELEKTMELLRKRFKGKEQQEQLTRLEEFFHTYIMDNMGYITKNTKLATPSKMIQYTIDKILGKKKFESDYEYDWISDHSLIEKINKKLEEKGYETRFTESAMMSLSNIEAKYELVSLLSYPKTVITNYFGGTIATLSLGGFKRFKQALDLMKTEEFKKRIELEGIEPDFITNELNIIVDPIKTDYPKAYKEFKKIVSSKLSSKEKMKMIKTLLKENNIPDEIISKTGEFFMRKPETFLRTHAFAVGEIMAKEMGLKGQDIITHARKFVEQTQYIYHNAARGEFNRTSAGKILTRFQHYMYQTIGLNRNLNESYRTFKYKQGSEEYEQAKRWYGAMALILALSAIFPYSLFETGLPPHLEAMKDLSGAVFGGESERKSAFYGTYGLNLISAPMVSRLILRPMLTIMNSDYENWIDREIWGFFPFGRLARGVTKSIENPYYTVDRMLGVPMVGLLNYRREKENNVIERPKGVIPS
jgi:hypothetical protein